MSQGPLKGPESALPLEPELPELLPEPEPPLDEELPELPLEPEELELEEAFDPELLVLPPDPEEPPVLEPPELLLELDFPTDPELPELPLEPELLLGRADPLLASEALASEVLPSGGVVLSSLEPHAHKIAATTATAKRVRTRMVDPSSSNSFHHHAMSPLPTQMR